MNIYKLLQKKEGSFVRSDLNKIKNDLIAASRILIHWGICEAQPNPEPWYLIRRRRCTDADEMFLTSCNGRTEKLFITYTKMYSDSGVAARRFQKKHRNQLLHSDIKYGPYLPIGKDGASQNITHLVLKAVKCCILIDR